MGWLRRNDLQLPYLVAVLTLVALKVFGVL